MHIASPAEHELLRRTSGLRTDVLELLGAASQDPRTDDSAMLVSHLQHVANDLGAAERMLLHEAPRVAVAVG